MQLNGAQRAVLCIALGALLVVVGLALQAWWWPSSDGGWFNYAPNNGVVFSPTDNDRILGTAILWSVLTLIWTAGSLVALRTVARAGERPPGPGDDRS